MGQEGSSEWVRRVICVGQRGHLSETGGHLSGSGGSSELDRWVI